MNFYYNLLFSNLKGWVNLLSVNLDVMWSKFKCSIECVLNFQNVVKMIYFCSQLYIKLEYVLKQQKIVVW